jgi:hypothetical protein
MTSSRASAGLKAIFSEVLILIGPPVCGLRPVASSPLAHLQNAETRRADLLAILQAPGDPLHHLGEDLVGLTLGQFMRPREPLRNIAQGQDRACLLGRSPATLLGRLRGSLSGS